MERAEIAQFDVAVRLNASRKASRETVDGSVPTARVRERKSVDHCSRSGRNETGQGENADEPRTIRRFDMSAPQLFYTLTRIAFPNKALHEKRAFRFGRRYVGNSRDQVQICGARSPERSGLRPDRRGSKPNEVEKLFFHRTLSGVQGWLGQHNRCIVPADLVLRILGYEAAKTPKWFALSQDRPLFAFAGLMDPLARCSRTEGRASRWAA